MSDNADDLELHINPSNSSSYGGTGNTITDLAGSYTVTKDSAISFDIDNGGYFDKTNTDGITTNYSPDNLTEFTAEVWVNPDSGGQNVSTLLSVVDSSNNNRLLTMYLRGNQRQIQFATYENDDATFVRWNPVGDTSVVYNEWQHLVMTCKNNGNMVIYLDGEVKQTLSFPNTMNTSVANLEIGHIPTNSSYGFNGQMGAVRFYSKQLSASDVGQNYRHGRDYIYTDLVDDTDLALHLDAGDNTTVSASTWTDLTSNSYDGTFTNFSSTLTDFYEKELGNFITFDGTNDYIKINNTSLTKSVGTDFTVEAWVRMHTTGTSDYIVSQTTDDGDYQNWLLRFHSDNKIKFYVYGTDAYLSTTSTYSANVWYHIVGLVEPNGTVRIYVNGELEASSSSGKSADTVARNTFIGSLGSQQTIDSDIGQVRIYHTALTQDQIRQNFNFTKNKYPNGFNGTINGATWNSGGYFDFDGNGDYIDADSLRIPNGNLTLAVWLKKDGSDTTTNNRRVAQIECDANGDAGLLDVMYKASTRTYTIRSGSSSTNVLTYQTNTTEQPDDTWFHFVVTNDHDSATTKLYINGVEEDSENVSRTLDTENKTAFGARTANDLSYNGKMSIIKVYDRVFSSSEVTAEFNNKKSDFGL